jgi:hypothetical protein
MEESIREGKKTMDATKRKKVIEKSLKRLYPNQSAMPIQEQPKPFDDFMRRLLVVYRVENT